MNVVTIILIATIVNVVAIQLTQHCKLSKLRKEVETLPNILKAAEPEPCEAIEKPAISEAKSDTTNKEPEASKKEGKNLSSEDILFWTILGIIATLGIFFAIAL